MDIRGACHCGNLRFDLAWPDAAARIPARACTCTFCRKHGATWTSHPEARLHVHIEAPAHIERYAFGTQTADFHVCSACGATPVVTSTIDGAVYAVVSVNAFDNVGPELLRRGPVSFDGEGTGDRLARRQRHWIAQVVFRDGA